jgi:hypothetical protein
LYALYALKAATLLHEGCVLLLHTHETTTLLL